MCRGKKQNLVKGDVTFCTSATGPHYTGLSAIEPSQKVSALKGSSLLEAPSLHGDIKSPTPFGLFFETQFICISLAILELTM